MEKWTTTRKLWTIRLNLDSEVLKRKATEDPSEVGAITDTRACKRRRLAIKERTEAGAENEFRARSSGIYFLTKKFVNFRNTPKFQVRNWILMIYFLLLHRSHRRLSSLWRRQRRFWKLHRFQKKWKRCEHRYLRELWNGWIVRRLTNKLKKRLINGRKLWNISEWWAVPESFFYFLILLIDFFHPLST